MNTIPEIQAELRSMAAEFHDRIVAITQSLTELESRGGEGGRQQTDLERLARQGERRPVRRHPLQGLALSRQISYLGGLCALAQDAPQADNGLLLIQRIASGLEMGTLERPLAFARGMGEVELEELCGMLTGEGLAASFLLDAMLVRLCCGSGCPRTAELLERVALLLELPLEEVAFLAKLAGILDRQDADAYLALGPELLDRDLPGLGYIQDNGEILCTEDPGELKKHRFRRLILRNCALDSQALLWASRAWTPGASGGETPPESIQIQRCLMEDCVIQLDRGVNTIFSHIVFVKCSFLMVVSSIGSLYYNYRYGNKFLDCRDSRLLGCFIKVYDTLSPRSSTEYLEYCCHFQDTEREGLQVAVRGGMAGNLNAWLEEQMSQGTGGRR